MYINNALTTWSFVHLFNRYLMSMYYLLSTMSSSGNKDEENRCNSQSSGIMKIQLEIIQIMILLQMLHVLQRTFISRYLVAISLIIL